MMQFDDYRETLKLWIDSKSQRGIKQQLADHLGCHPSLVSQVVAQRQHFTLEQTHRLADFMQLSKVETKTLILCVGRDRAGTADLRQYYQEELDSHMAESTQIKKRIQPHRELDQNDAIVYYSDWMYSAVHVLLTTKKHSLNEICQKLSVSRDKALRVLNFLLTLEMIKEEKGGYTSKALNLHLSTNDQVVDNHHKNWRQYMLHKMSERSSDDFHYSGCWTVTPRAAAEIRERFLNELKSSMKVVTSAKKCEQMYAMCWDFCRLA